MVVSAIAIIMLITSTGGAYDEVKVKVLIVHLRSSCSLLLCFWQELKYLNLNQNSLRIIFICLELKCSMGVWMNLRPNSPNTEALQNSTFIIGILPQ